MPPSSSRVERVGYARPVTSLVLMAAVGIAIARLIQHFSAERTMRRAMRAALPSTIAEARAGSVVKLTGTVVNLNAPLLAPMSGRPCACYLVIVEENRSGSWVTIFRDSRGEDFLIEDGTGRARVVTQSVNVLAVNGARRTSGR